MLQLDAKLSHLQPFVVKLVEALERNFGASKLDNVIINTGTVFELSVVNKLDHWQFCVTHVRLPHLRNEAIGDLLTDESDVVLLSSIGKRGSRKFTSSHTRAMPPEVGSFLGPDDKVRHPNLCGSHGEDC